MSKVDIDGLEIELEKYSPFAAFYDGRSSINDKTGDYQAELLRLGDMIIEHKNRMHEIISEEALKYKEN